MIGQFEKTPYYVPFTFTSINDDQRLQAEVLFPHNVAVYGITITGSTRPQSQFYHFALQFLNYHSGNVLFDEPLSNLCIQTDARTYWSLPSAWYVRKNEKVICQLDAYDDITTTTVYLALLGYVIDNDPNPGLQPFVYSFPISIGFQDNVSGDTSALPFNRGMTGTMAKHALYDFDIHAIVLDPWGGTGVGATPAMSFQLSTQRRKLFDRFIIDGAAGGGTTFSQFDTFNWMATSANLHAWPEDNVQQWRLAKPERVCKGELIRVDVAPAPTYVGTNSIHSNLNQIANMAVIGNHIA